MLAWPALQSEPFQLEPRPRPLTTSLCNQQLHPEPHSWYHTRLTQNTGARDPRRTARLSQLHGCPFENTNIKRTLASQGSKAASLHTIFHFPSVHARVRWQSSVEAMRAVGRQTASHGCLQVAPQHGTSTAASKKREAAELVVASQRDDLTERKPAK